MDSVARIKLGSILILILAAVGCGAPVEKPPRSLNGDHIALSWTYQTAGPINLSPIAAGDFLIVAPLAGPVLAIDSENGKLVWSFNPPDGVWERAVAVDEDQVYVGTRGGGLAAVDIRSGALQWQVNLGVEVQAPPNVDDKIVYVTSTFVGPDLPGDPFGRAKLFAVDTKNGDILWSFESDSYILQTPFVLENQIFVGGSYYDSNIQVDEGGPMRLYALSKGDGSLLWLYEAVDGYIKALYAYDQVVSYIAYTDFVYGLNAQTGNLLWSQETGNWVPFMSGNQNTIYFGSANTVVHARSLQDGGMIWSYNIPEGSFNYALGAPLRVEDDLYFLTQRGDIVALSAVDGALLWRISTDTRSRVGLSVGDGALFLGDENGMIYAYTDR